MFYGDCDEEAIKALGTLLTETSHASFPFEVTILLEPNEPECYSQSNSSLLHVNCPLCHIESITLLCNFFIIKKLYILPPSCSLKQSYH